MSVLFSLSNILHYGLHSFHYPCITLFFLITFSFFLLSLSLLSNTHLTFLREILWFDHQLTIKKKKCYPPLRKKKNCFPVYYYHYYLVILPVPLHFVPSLCQARVIGNHWPEMNLIKDSLNVSLSLVAFSEIVCQQSQASPKGPILVSLIVASLHCEFPTICRAREFSYKSSLIANLYPLWVAVAKGTLMRFFAPSHYRKPASYIFFSLSISQKASSVRFTELARLPGKVVTSLPDKPLCCKPAWWASLPLTCPVSLASLPCLPHCSCPVQRRCFVADEFGCACSWRVSLTSQQVSC